jgi:hypothetical protein
MNSCKAVIQAAVGLNGREKIVAAARWRVNNFILQDFGLDSGGIKRPSMGSREQLSPAAKSG